MTMENKAALRTAIAALAAILVAFKLHLPNPYWAGMTVVIVSNLYTGSIIDKAAMRIIGTIVGAVLGFYGAGIVANSFLLYLLSSFLIIAVSVYCYYSSRYGYAYLLGALCAFLIISQVTFDPHNAFFVAIWRPVEIGIGVLVCAIVIYLVFPNHLKDNILMQLDALLHDFATEYKQLFSCLSCGEWDRERGKASSLKMKKKLLKTTVLIRALDHEWGAASRIRTEQLRAILETLHGLLRQIYYLTTIPCSPSELLLIKQLPLASIFAAIEHDFKQIQLALVNGDAHLQLKTVSVIQALEQRLEQQKATSLSQSEPFSLSLLLFCKETGQGLLRLYALLFNGDTESMKQQTQVLFFSKKERVDYEVLTQSIKAGIAVLFALGFWLVSNWPGGINGIISSLVISVRKNPFEMKSVILHRLAGCSIGGGLALVSLACMAMNLYDLVMILFFGVWAFTYLMFKYPKYSYIGLQANIALIITLAQDGGPPVLLDPPLQRLAGVVIGIVASFIAANLLWRSDAWTLLGRYFKNINDFIVFNFEQVFLNQGNSLKLHDVANLFWSTRTLIESLENMPLTVDKQKQLDKAQQQLDALAMMNVTCNHIVGCIDRERARKTALLFDCNLGSYEKELLQLFRNPTSKTRESLKHQFHALKTEAKGKGMNSYQDMSNLLAYIHALEQLVFVDN